MSASEKDVALNKRNIRSLAESFKKQQADLDSVKEEMHALKTQLSMALSAQAEMRQQLAVASVASIGRGPTA